MTIAPDPILTLIEALAADLVREYLTEQAAPGNDSSAERPERVPLRDVDRAA